MDSDVIHFLVGAGGLIAVVGGIYGALLLYEKKTGKWPGNGSTSVSDSMNDISNSID